MSDLVQTRKNSHREVFKRTCWHCDLCCVRPDSGHVRPHEGHISSGRKLTQPWQVHMSNLNCDKTFYYQIFMNQRSPHCTPQSNCQLYLRFKEWDGEQDTETCVLLAGELNNIKQIHLVQMLARLFQKHYVSPPSVHNHCINTVNLFEGRQKEIH